MKILGILLMSIIAFAMLALPLALAEDSLGDVSTIDSDLNVTSVSGMKMGWMKLGLAFTWNQEKKAEKELQLARLSLMQARIAAKNNDTQGFQKALENHNRYIQRIQERLDSLDGQNKEKGIINSARQLIAMQKAIEVHNERIERLKDLLLNENLTDERRTQIESKLEKAENVTARLSEIQDNKKEEMKTKLRAVTNRTEEEIEQDIEEIEDSQNLTSVLKTIAEKRIEKAREAVSKLNERIAEEKTRRVNVSFFEEQIALAEANINASQALFDQGNYSGAIETIRPIGNFGRNMAAIVHNVREAREQNRSERVRDVIEQAKENRANLREERRNNTHSDSNETESDDDSDEDDDVDNFNNSTEIDDDSDSNSNETEDD